jgi:antitoxin FitA
MMKQRKIRGLTAGTPRRQAQLLVRDVPLELVEALKKRAAERGRSAEAEHRMILEEALRPDTSDFWEEAAKLRDETRGRKWTNSTDLIRQDRDAR